MNSKLNLRSLEGKYIPNQTLIKWDNENIDNNQKENCKNLITKYIHYCDNSLIFEGIDQFFDNNWYNITLNKINDNMSYNDIKLLLNDLGKFKNILKITDIINDNKLIKLEDDILNCILSRIEYKYRCVTKKKRDYNHDKEISYHIFHRERYLLLKNLFSRIREKYRTLKEQKHKEKKDIKRLLKQQFRIKQQQLQQQLQQEQKQEQEQMKLIDEQYAIYDENLDDVSSSSSSNNEIDHPFIVVTKKPKIKHKQHKY